MEGATGYTCSVKLRLMLAAISILVQETILTVALLVVLPRMAVILPVWVVAIILFGWAAVSVLPYRAGSQALRQPVRPLLSMIGRRGRVARPLSPEGFVYVDGELWQARSVSGKIEAGGEVMVVAEEGMHLTVRVVSPKP